MTEFALHAAINFPLVAVLLAVLHSGRRRPESLVGCTVVIQTDHGQTFRGVLHAEYADSYALRQVVAVTAGGERAIDHVLRVPRERVSSLQEVLAVREAGT